MINKMVNLLVLLFLFNIYALKISAICNSTARFQTISSKLAAGGDTTSAQLSSKTDHIKQPNSTFNSSSDNTILNYDSHQPGTSMPMDDKYNLNELDTLRLEYYKYKILSHLDITTNPDDLRASSNYEIDNRRINYKLANIRANTSGSSVNSKKSTLINSRQKRSLACSEVKSDKDACCLETFYVNFTDIGWDKWILYPTGYNANYCRGQCDLSHARYYHSTLLSKFSSMIGLCCSPRQMAPLSLLYIDENNKVLQKSVPDMIVESCDCA